MKLSIHRENKERITVRELAALAVLAALLFAVQVGLSFLPNIELVSLCVLVYTLIWKEKTLYVIYVFVLLEGVFYGFGIWWVMYLYVWTILYFVVRLCRVNQSVIIWAIINGFFGLSFGLLCALPYAVAGGIGAGIAWWSAGILFDIIHGIGNFIVTLVLFKPLHYILCQLKQKTVANA